MASPGLVCEASERVGYLRPNRLSDADTDGELQPANQWEAMQGLWFRRLFTGNLVASLYDVRPRSEEEMGEGRIVSHTPICLR